jgi:hypothetical protein
VSPMRADWPRIICPPVKSVTGVDRPRELTIHRTDANPRGNDMTASSSASRRTRCILAVAATAVIVVAGSVWADGNGQQASTTAGTARIEVAGLISSTDIAKLLVVNVEQPI